jgi:hypothetical protein
VTRVLVLTAIDLEAKSLARQLGLAAVAGSGWPHFRRGVLEIACIGVRGARLHERSSAWRPPTIVISAGACGALAPDLREGAVVVPEAVLTPTGERLATDPLPGLSQSGVLLSTRDIADTAAAKARLWTETGALAVDMESAVVVTWARTIGARAAVLRGVSDTAQHGVPADLAGLVEPDGHVSTGRAVRVMLSRPRAVGQALTLRRGTAAALASVAGALGKIARAVGT